jgi:D-alanine-D-alanine ligase
MTRVGILFGGPSAEHTVSCSSALAVVRALPEHYQPVVIGIERDGRFRLVPTEIVDNLREQPPAARAIDDRLEVVGREVELASGRPVPTALVVAGGDVEATVDVVFPLLHGPFGEDGVLQGFLETLGVPYVGCGVTASAIGMDKVAMKRAFIAEDIPITPHVHVTEARWRAATDPLALVEKLERPLFVKPANMGSSIGISMVNTDAELAPAVERALAYDHTIMIEQGVRGREIECSVLGGFEPAASAVGEVTVTGGWFDYEQKYFADADPMIVPADLPENVADEVRDLSIRAFQAVGGWGLARVDFLYDETAEAIYVNELNTMPGFTAHSMYPKAWAAARLSYPDLIVRLIGLAFERHDDRARRSSAMVRSASSAHDRSTA